MQPLFLTNKLKILNLSLRINIHDFQLRDHFLLTTDLYAQNCLCSKHKHYGKKCRITNEKVCSKCQTEHTLVISNNSILYHQDVFEKKIYHSLPHKHEPPCGVCINCTTIIACTDTESKETLAATATKTDKLSMMRKKCLVKEPFMCHITTDVICSKTKRFNKLISEKDLMIHHHIFNIKSPLFYFCSIHEHRHLKNPAFKCQICTNRCCDKAIPLKNYTRCFIVSSSLEQQNLQPQQQKQQLQQQQQQRQPSTSTSSIVKTIAITTDSNGCRTKDGSFTNIEYFDENNAMKNSITTTTAPLPLPSSSSSSQSLTPFTNVNGQMMQTKIINYIIFDPSIWREQSYNHFMSFIRAIIISPHMASERYKRFENSNFSISNVKRYISGKESIIRTAVTGFETQGLYQTSTISCTIPYYAVLIPIKLYEILKRENYDLTYALLKRDPSLSSTCLFVCAAFINPDPTVDVITISDQQSKGFNQDQDGDKNAGYFIRKIVNGYYAYQTYEYKLAKLELALQFRKKQTLMATPRYHLSETTLLLMERNRQELLNEDLMPASVEYFRRTYKRGVKFVNDASAGYLSEEYDAFQQNIMHLHNINQLQYITTDDLTLRSNKLYSIVTSGAKGNRELLDLFLRNITSIQSLDEYKKSMIDLCNKYILSNQDLSRNGRKQFISLYAAQDLIAFNENIYINKIFYANYSYFASAIMYIFNEVSLELFLEDLLGLEMDENKHDVASTSANSSTLTSNTNIDDDDHDGNQNDDDKNEDNEGLN